MIDSEVLYTKGPAMAETEDPETCTPPPLLTSTNSSTLPRSARRCRIPKLNRSTSVRTRTDSLKSEGRPKSLTMSRDGGFPWHLENGRCDSIPCSMDDDGSVKSFSSYVSFGSFASRQSQGTEASLSRPISRCHYGKRYVLHCDRHLAKQEEYLTPTQRKEKEIRQLKTALVKQTKICGEKDLQIEKLQAEVQILHDAISKLQESKLNCLTTSQDSDTTDSLEKNSTSVMSFSSGSESNDHIHNNNVVNNIDDSGISNDILSFSPSVNGISNDILSFSPPVNGTVEFDGKMVMVDKSVATDAPLFRDCDDWTCSTLTDTPTPTSRPKQQAEAPKHQQMEPVITTPKVSRDLEQFLSTYKHDLDQLKLQHMEQYQDLKGRIDDKVDDLVKRMSEANLRYTELRPLFNHAQDKIESIESQLCEVQKDIQSQDEYHNQMYLKMYRKGQVDARCEDEPPSHRRGSVPELLHQLKQLEGELEQARALYREASRGVGDRQAEYTLRFLKDSVFYFLTKKDKDHLKAIQSILGFTDAERMSVAKAMKHRRLFCSPFKLKK